MADEVTLFENPEQAVLEDIDENEDFDLHPLVSLIMDGYKEAKRARLETEQRWVKNYYNFRGLYHPSVKFTDTEKSRAFIKITKTKVQAGYGQLLEILFSNGSFPLSIQPTKIPEGISEVVHFDPRDPKQEQQNQEISSENVAGQVIGFEGDGNDVQQGESLTDRLGRAVSKMFSGAVPKEGASDEAEERQISPAEVSALKMQKKILDQLTESDAVNHICKSMFECTLLGTGVIKGPFSVFKEYPKWDENGNYNPVIKVRPRIEHVSIWDVYPDSSAKTVSDLEKLYQRHRFTKSQLRKLKREPFFRQDSITKAVDRGPNFEDEWWESELSERSRPENEERYEAVEFWGTLDREFIEDVLDTDIPDELQNEEELQANVWVCNGIIIRAVLNPFKPRRLQYHFFEYEIDPYNFFGVGIPENMEDSQTLMNGFARLSIDNAVFAGSVMLEVDETNLVPGQDFAVYPGKIWRRQGGAPGQAVFATKWPSTANENMQMFDRFRVLADESTGIPSFSHGQTGVSGVGRTASGISMLLSAASLNTKTVIKNIDNNLLHPLGEAMFAFNMQFDFDPEIVGDLEVKARGTSSLMQKEVKTQRLLQFLQISSSPVLAATVNFEELLRDIARSMDLDEDKLILDPKKAAINLALMQQAQQIIGGGSPQQTAANDEIGGGGGNIGVGAAPTPENPQFSGNLNGGTNDTNNQQS